jgi:hypothetical protein
MRAAQICEGNKKVNNGIINLCIDIHAGKNTDKNSTEGYTKQREISRERGNQRLMHR